MDAMGAFKRQVAGDSARVQAALTSVAPLIDNWSRTWGALSEYRRTRKFARIKAALHPAAVDAEGNGFRILWIIPDAHDVVIVFGACGGRARGAFRWSTFPVLEVTSQALSMLPPGVAITAALYEAATAFLRADRHSVEAARGAERNMFLPAGSAGLFLATPVSGIDAEGRLRIIARVSAHIAADIAGTDQRPIPAALDRASSVLASAVAVGAV